MPSSPTKLCARCGQEKRRLEFCGTAWCHSCEEAYSEESRTALSKGRCPVHLGIPVMPSHDRCQICVEEDRDRRPKATRRQAARRRSKE